RVTPGDGDGAVASDPQRAQCNSQRCYRSHPAERGGCDRRARHRSAGPAAAEAGLGDANPGRARAALAGLDVEGDLLPAGERVEASGRLERAPVEEVLLAVLGGDEAEATVVDQLLDGSRGHLCLLPSRFDRTNARVVREGRRVTANPAGCRRGLESSTRLRGARGPAPGFSRG